MPRRVGRVGRTNTRRGPQTAGRRQARCQSGPGRPICRPLARRPSGDRALPKARLCAFDGPASKQTGGLSRGPPGLCLHLGSMACVLQPVVGARVGCRAAVRSRVVVAAASTPPSKGRGFGSKQKQTPQQGAEQSVAKTAFKEGGKSSSEDAAAKARDLLAAKSPTRIVGITVRPARRGACLATRGTRADARWRAGAHGGSEGCGAGRGPSAGRPRL